MVAERNWIHSVQPKGHLPCCDFLLPSRRDSRLQSRIFPFCINQDFRVTKRAIDRNKASKRRKDGLRALHFLVRMGARHAWTRGGHEEIWTLNAIKSTSFCCNMEGSAFPSKNRPNPGQGFEGATTTPLKIANQDALRIYIKKTFLCGLWHSKFLEEVSTWRPQPTWYHVILPKKQYSHGKIKEIEIIIS